MFLLLAVILSVGAINALIPIMVIIILIAAAAGATRGFSFFNVFGISQVMSGIGSIGGASRGSAARTGYSLRVYLDPKIRYRSKRSINRDIARKQAIKAKMRQAAYAREGPMAATAEAKKAAVIKPGAGWATKLAVGTKSKMGGSVKSGGIVRAISPIAYGVGAAGARNFRAYSPKTEKRTEPRPELEKKDLERAQELATNTVPLATALEARKVALKKAEEELRDKKQEKETMPVGSFSSKTFQKEYLAAKQKVSGLRNDVKFGEAALAVMPYRQKAIKSRLEKVEKHIGKINELKKNYDAGEITAKQFNKGYSRIYDSLYGPSDKSITHHLTNPYYGSYFTNKVKSETFEEKVSKFVGDRSPASPGEGSAPVAPIVGGGGSAARKASLSIIEEKAGKGGQTAQNKPDQPKGVVPPREVKKEERKPNDKSSAIAEQEKHRKEDLEKAMERDRERREEERKRLEAERKRREQEEKDENK